ncbi:MAG TPA: asparagine synthase (glutamine-hydrolyzing) [Thermoanaerobaculia bacterium]|nr:asparagine synthase (glutamine-hydrolyzing) [Thermoanaerobaculia bacterium]
MCGIAGVLAVRVDVLTSAEAMHARLAHRGPDAERIERAGNALLCHRRLSIIDLSEGGAQPMWDSSRRYCIAYNGEIYNYRELREECISRGASFRSSSDTEVILELFRLDGEASFARLNGMFALALVDTSTGEAWLVRDPVGIKPLYWASTNVGVAFASELRALLASGVVPLDVDQEALQAYAQLDFVPAPMSIVRGVCKLPGGMLLHVRRDGVVTERLYCQSPDGLKPVLHATSASEDVERFDRVIRDAVTRQLIADVPVGIFLSGGIDSSIVARVASDVAGRVSTFSVAFDDVSFDETRWFEEVARAVGSEHHTERLTSSAMLELMPNVANVASEPLADGSIFPTMLLSRFTRQHVKVALSGDGADELFAGYPTHRLVGAGQAFARIPRGARRAIASAAHKLLPVSHANLSLDFRVKKFIDGADRDPIVQNERWLGTFRVEELPSLLTSFDPAAQERLVAAWHEPSRGVDDPLEAVLRTDQRFYLQDGVLVKVDRASMASSLEVRVPMLDLEMIHFANGLPADRKLRHGRSKWILREWARKHFSPAIWQRPKKGFGAPLARWFREDLREFVRDTLAPQSLARDGFFAPRAVQALLEEHERGTRDQRKRIFNVLMFTLWYRCYR